MDTATVPAELAHKADHRNMWLTGTARRDAHSVVFGFRIPDTVRPGIAEYVELQRQATHAFAHLQLGVPLGSRAMLSTAELLLDERRSESADEGRVRAGLPREGLVAVRANVDGRAARGVADIDVGIRFVAAVESATAPGDGDSGGDADGGRGSRSGAIGTGRITGKYLPQRLYDRIRGASARRGHAAENTAAAQDVTAVDPAVAPTAVRVVEELTVDAANPILSDHETDHISGMVVVCAAERLARQHFPERRLRGIVTRFLSFIEKSEPAHVVLHELDGRLRVTVVQRGAPCAHVDGVLDDDGPPVVEGCGKRGAHDDGEGGEDAR